MALRVPAIDIHTVGAGGGSIARCDAGGSLQVGPESAGADPGPACYGRGTAPTVTDANVVLGRLDPTHFLGGDMYLDVARAERAIAALARQLKLSLVRTAEGIVQVVNAAMTRALRVISVERGHDPRAFTLVAFGGAAAVHACDLASQLGMRRVLIPRHPGVLSAAGMAAAPMARDFLTTVRLVDPSPRALTRLAAPWLRRGAQELVQRRRRPSRDRRPDVRADAVPRASARGRGAARARLSCSLRCDARADVRSRCAGSFDRGARVAHGSDGCRAAVRRARRAPRPRRAPAGSRHALVWGGRSLVVPRHERDDLEPGTRLARSGADRRVQLDDAHSARVAWTRRRRPTFAPRRGARVKRKAKRVAQLDPIALAVLHHRLAAIAEEMGVRLGHTGFSPNIKERRDYSCALFDAAGRLVAQAAHIPVHLGSTPLSVQAALAAHPTEPGDVIALNDPYAGGTHLPDLTLVAPVHSASGRLLGFVANRAHHADIGGMTPGSMPLAREIYQEGFRLPPVRLVRRGELVRDVLALFLANTRVPDEREGDLDAQRGALAVGAARLIELAGEIGTTPLAHGMGALQDYSERLMAATLRALPSGVYRAEDVLDDDGIGTSTIPIRVAIHVAGGRVRVDFSGSAPQVEGSLNANYAITLSAVFYVFMTLGREPIPANDGVLRRLHVHAPEGSVVNANFPSAVAGGNVETSQRIVDVLLRALAGAAPTRIPAASQGSMNNLAVGGYDRRRRRAFSYYETIAGGAGAGPHGPGASGIHTHMTNTLNTPIEALEAYYPLRVRRYAVRRTRAGGTPCRGVRHHSRTRVLGTDGSDAPRRTSHGCALGPAGGSPGRCGATW